MGLVPDEEIAKKDAEIGALVKEIGDLANEFQAAADDAQKVELINKISEKEKDLRAARQKKGQFKAVQAGKTKLW